jgi:hypothetical protein
MLMGVRRQILPAIFKYQIFSLVTGRNHILTDLHGMWPEWIIPSDIMQRL